MKWISVKERLPEKGQYVVIYVPEFTPYQIWNAYLSEESKENIWMGDNPSGYPCWNINDVTHWAEMPEPPSETK